MIDRNAPWAERARHQMGIAHESAGCKADSAILSVLRIIIEHLTEDEKVPLGMQPGEVENWVSLNLPSPNEPEATEGEGYYSSPTVVEDGCDPWVTQAHEAFNHWWASRSYPADLQDIARQAWMAAWEEGCG